MRRHSIGRHYPSIVGISAIVVGLAISSVGLQMPEPIRDALRPLSSSKGEGLTAKPASFPRAAGCRCLADGAQAVAMWAGRVDRYQTSVRIADPPPLGVATGVLSWISWDAGRMHAELLSTADHQRLSERDPRHMLMANAAASRDLHPTNVVCAIRPMWC